MLQRKVVTMSPAHVSSPQLLLLLHCTAAAVLATAMPSTTADIQNVTNKDATESEAPTSRPGEQITAITEGTVLPTVRLYCLENRRKVLHCDPGTHHSAFIHWTLDGKDLSNTQALFQENNKIITLESGVLGNITCTVRGNARSLTSLSIKLHCEGDSWLFYSIIMSIAGGSACLLSLIVCAITCCCRRRSGHLPVTQEELEMGPVFVDVHKKPKVEEVHEVEETTPITNKTKPNVKPTDDGFQFPTPPDMDDFRPEQDGNAIGEKGQNASAAGSEDSSDGHDDNMVDNGSNSVHGN